MKKLFFLSLAVLLALPLGNVYASTSEDLIQEIASYGSGDASFTKGEVKGNVQGVVVTNEGTARGSLSLTALADMDAKALSEDIKFSLAGNINGEQMTVHGKAELRAFEEKLFAILKSFTYTGKNSEINLAVAEYLDQWFLLTEADTAGIWDQSPAATGDITTLLNALGDALADEGAPAKVVEKVKSGAVFEVKKSEEAGKVVYTVSLNKASIMGAFATGELTSIEKAGLERIAKTVRATVKLTADPAKKIITKIQVRLSLRKMGEIKNLTVVANLSATPLESVTIEEPTEYTEFPPKAE